MLSKKELVIIRKVILRELEPEKLVPILNKYLRIRQRIRRTIEGITPELLTEQLATGKSLEELAKYFKCSRITIARKKRAFNLIRRKE